MPLDLGTYPVSVSATTRDNALTVTDSGDVIVYEAGSYSAVSHHQGAKPTHSATASAAQGEAFDAVASASASASSAIESIRDLQALTSAPASSVGTLLERYEFSALTAAPAAAPVTARKVLDITVAASASAESSTTIPESYGVPTITVTEDGESNDVSGGLNRPVISSVVQLHQGSWQRLVFPITSNGDPLNEINDAKLVLFKESRKQATLAMDSGEITFYQGQLLAVLDETITSKLERGYTFELWIRDVFDNPMFVTKGKMHFMPTRARI